MKTGLKIILISLIALFGATAHAQKKSQEEEMKAEETVYESKVYTIGWFGIGKPILDKAYDKSASYGFGGDLINGERLRFGISMAYLIYGGSTTTVAGYSYGYGYTYEDSEYYLLLNGSLLSRYMVTPFFYVGGLVGASYDFASSNVLLTVAPTAGFEIWLSKFVGLDLGVKYYIPFGQPGTVQVTMGAARGY